MTSSHPTTFSARLFQNVKQSKINNVYFKEVKNMKKAELHLIITKEGN